MAVSELHPATPARGIAAVPSTRQPPYAAVRQCLGLQSDAAPLSPFAWLIGIDPLARTAKRAYRGALAELAVVAHLDGLGDDWTVLNSVPAAGNGADRSTQHLVVGAAGLLTVTTKSHSGQKVWVGERTFIADDERFDHLSQIEQLADGIEQRMSAAAGFSLPVSSCLVLDDPLDLVVGRRHPRIDVVTLGEFARWLDSLPRMLSADAVERLAGVARSDSAASPDLAATGTGTGTDTGTDSAAPLAEFAALRRAVVNAGLRRLLLAGLGVALSLLALRLNFTAPVLLQLLPIAR